eukprot:Phypoly_transcript_01092.p1 GENE.Phypoly_transcript_01092~~Phypoly_transcript_01092.p1  ORF type:complete len:1198 (+),score=219.95 Phypoly_transcript_01092:455-3595(+)
MNQTGMLMVSRYQFVVKTTDTTNVDSTLNTLLTDFTSNYDMGDVILFAVSSAYYDSIVHIMSTLKPNISGAAFFIPSELRTAQSLNAYDYSGWLFDIPYVNTTSYGVSGINGGTSGEFYQNYLAKYGHSPSYQAVVMAASLLVYGKAVEAAGTLNSTTVAQALAALDPLDTFYGKVKFINNGTDPFVTNQKVQYINNQPVVIGDNHTFAYPAPFPWTIKAAINTTIVHEKGKTPVGVIAGATVGGAVFVIGALILGFFVIKRQRAMVVEVLNKVEEGERRAYRIDMKQVEVNHLIGSGSFGYVYTGTYRGADVAIKKLKKQNLTKKQLEEFTNEAAIMVGLRHPNILLFMGVNSTPPDLCIITELMPRGSLFDVLHEQYEIPFQFRIKMALDVLKGLQFIHSAGFIHRDLKSPNLLIDKSWNIKIADFGLSAGKASLDDEAQISLLWTAPEILTKEKNCYSELSDVYSFAVILWELMSRKVPFECLPPGTIATRVVQGHRPEIDPNWDKQVQQVLRFTWDGNKEQRVDVKTARRMIEEINIGDTESANIRPMQRGAATGSSHPPSTSGITFVTMELINANAVWELPQGKAVAVMKKMQELLNQHCISFAGYITQTLENRYTVAFSNVVGALNFCLKFQEGLAKISIADETPGQIEVEEFTTNDEKQSQTSRLQASMGVHSTVPVVSRDSDTNAVKYTGPGVTIPDTLCTLAHGGQILFGADVYSMAMQSINALEPFLVESLGYKKDSELPEYFNIYQMVPASFTTSFEYFQSHPVPPKTPLTFLINYKDITVDTVIGSGSFGAVYAAKYNGHHVIFKQFTKQKYAEIVDIQMRAEAAHLCKLENENVVKFYGLVPTAPNMGFVAEQCMKGGLNQVLYDQTKDLPWSRRLEFAIGAAKGLAYLHSHNIIHADLKSANLLISDNNKVKISDVGFSRIKLDNQTMTQIGAVAWTAPEVTRDTLYSTKSDVYSFAIILWEMVFRTRPWEGMHTMKIIAMVETGGRPPVSNWPVGIPQALLPIMQACWNGDPEQRPSFGQIVSQLEALPRS